MVHISCHVCGLFYIRIMTKRQNGLENELANGFTQLHRKLHFTNLALVMPAQV